MMYIKINTLIVEITLTVRAHAEVPMGQVLLG